MSQTPAYLSIQRRLQRRGIYIALPVFAAILLFTTQLQICVCVATLPHPEWRNGLAVQVARWMWAANSAGFIVISGVALVLVSLYKDVIHKYWKDATFSMWRWPLNLLCQTIVTGFLVVGRIPEVVYLSLGQSLANALYRCATQRNGSGLLTAGLYWRRSLLPRMAGGQ